MKTAPIGLDYMMPVWLAHAVTWLSVALFFGLGVAQASANSTQPDDFLWLKQAPLGIACTYILMRSRRLIPKLRDARFRSSMRKFRALERTEWGAMLQRVAHDPDIQIIRTERMTMANPLTWGSKQRVLTARDGAVLAEINESRGRVGSVRLRIIIQE